ncbi:MAG: heparinase II/III family protein, partial [Chloroflexota bacterium]
MGQSLDEAVWSIALAWAYDAVRDALAPDERRQIEDGLLHPVAAHLLGQRFRRVHNIECWHLAALASLGVVLADQACVEAALDEQYGFTAQLEGGVLADGWWWEGSPAYHFYTLQALLTLALALRRVLPQVLEHPRLRAMLDAPAELARADLSLPALNDCWFGVSAPRELARRAALYETAWTLWHDPAHAALLARLYAAGEPRRSTEALLFGPDILPAPAPSPPATRLFEASGYAVLRYGTAVTDERWLLLKFGPHGGGHGHPDKLSLDLHAFGKRLSPDLGTPGYGIPLNRTWYRHTLSHNTVLLDGLPQPPATGALVRFALPEQG